MRHRLHALAVLALLPALAQASPAPLLVFVVDDVAVSDVAARLSLERLKTSLEATLEAAPSAELGLCRGEPVSGADAALTALDEADDAWLRMAFDEADRLLRDAVAWALAHPAAMARDARLTARLAIATARLVQTAQLLGRDTVDDALLKRALAWWGEVPLSDDEVPADVAAQTARRAATDAGCRGDVRVVVVGGAGADETLVLGNHTLPLADEAALRLPCGTWTARRFDASGTPSDWEWRVTVAEEQPTSLAVLPRFERAARLQGEHSIEVRSYAGLVDDVQLLAGDRPFRLVALGVGADGHATARDLLEPNVPVAGAPSLAVTASAPRPASGARWAPWALYGVAVAAAATGAALHVVTNGWIADQNTGRGSYFDRIRAGKTGTVAAYGVAGGAALAGAIWHVAIW